MEEQVNDNNCERLNPNGSLSVAVDVRSNSYTVKDTTAWLRRSFGPVGAYGSIKKELFITALREVEDFVENLFNVFDKKGQGCISIQELVGGFGLLIPDKRGKQLRWFRQYFEKICVEEPFICLQQFTKALEDDAFANNFFKVFDLDGDGEVEMKSLIASIDRLDCASVDAKWYLWIQDKFDVHSSNDRLVSFAQFIKALNLKESFFAERFYKTFDTDGNGTIDMKELVDGLTLLTKGTEQEKLKFLFEVYDIDGNGVLNMEEIKIVFQSCIEESNLRIDEEQINELAEVFFEETDGDNKGYIGFDEFASFLKRHPGVAENLTITAGSLLNPSTKVTKKRFFNLKPKKRLERLMENPCDIIVQFLYILVNVALCIWVCIERKDEGGWVILARINGMCLNLNSVFILVLMLKGSLTWLRSTRIGQYFPIDHHIELHKALAGVVFLQSILHFVGHLGRYIVTESGIEVWEYLFTTRSGEGWVNGSAGITGVLLFVIFGVMGAMSMPFVRRKGYFELFYFTHHLYIVWWTLLILHAPNFWKWFIGPAVIYLVERILRFKFVNEARFGKTFVREGIVLPSKVTHLVISRPPNFNYKPGDYVLVNIPKIAKYEWHPFTISSSPELTETIWLHVRSVGTWTRKLYDYYENENNKVKGLVRGRSSKKSLRRLIREERDPGEQTSNVLPESDQQTNGLQKINEDIENKKNAVSIEVDEEQTPGNSMPLNKNGRPMKSHNVPAGLLEIYVDGPYGAPAVHFQEAEHAVLISSGIGVTPFASILQTIMLRYKSATHTCPNCEHCWLGKIPFSLKKLKKVDFFWINRDQAAFEWFISLLSQLEMEQSEACGALSEHFLDMHIYMTSALKKEDMKAIGLQLALELIHEKKERDIITGLRTRTKPGRPNWDQVFADLEAKNHGKISVFYCGNPALGIVLKDLCRKYKFGFRKENF